MSDKSEQKKMNFFKACLIAIAVLIVIIAFMVGLGKLGINGSWIGLLGIWYWASIKHFKMEDLKEVALGGLAALGIVSTIPLGSMLGAAGSAMFPLAVITGLGLYISGRFRVVFNDFTWLVVTVLTIPQITEVLDIPIFSAALLITLGFFGVIVYLAFNVIPKVKSKSVKSE
jgi:hypothetical protein